MYAAHYGHYQVVDELLKAGCDASVIDPTSGHNALMMAAANGHTYCVERLVGRVDLHARDKNGQTAADLAKNCGHGRNTALIRALQIDRTPADVLPQIRAPTDQRTFSNFNGSGLSAPNRWNRSSSQTPLLHAASTPYPSFGGRVPISRRLFQSGSTQSSVKSYCDIQGAGESSFDCKTSNQNLNVSNTDMKILGVSKLPKSRITDGSDSGTEMLGDHSPTDNTDKVLLSNLLKENDVLHKKVQELENVVKYFHSMTKQIICNVRTT